MNTRPEEDTALTDSNHDLVLTPSYAVDLGEQSYNCRTFGADVFSGAALCFLSAISAGIGAGFGAEAAMLNQIANIPPLFYASIGIFSGAAGGVISAAADSNTGYYMAGAAALNAIFYGGFSAAMIVIDPSLTTTSGAALGSVIGAMATSLTSLLLPRCSDPSIVNQNTSILKIGRRLFGLYPPRPNLDDDVDVEFHVRSTYGSRG